MAMPSNGKILNISSKAGKVGLANYSFYAASKFALEGMTSSWAKEFKERNIIVHSMSPGMVDTQSFPKPPGKPGVRTALSIRDCLLVALTASSEYSGHYIHADELDMAREKGLQDSAAGNPLINDPLPFRALSICDCLLVALTASSKYSGYYIHVDKLGMARANGLQDSAAWKPID
eukprot:CAMPEP_0113953224 /NCGR_PEP_ID=MMETSP1339-20121228/90865_1 /TAXON_ID=94617 /ORGANISM="Fibrocapsa japonica" /LENGTH=175 /DNA_ID=CAMNT_0000961945 /DNA_START=352 /DNA_END=880 /DNA_ORIENTATION=- /assembly_acc=CAM_ASM_000762